MRKKADFHIHSIDHEYFFGRNFTSLTEDDKRKIRFTVEWAIDRGLDYVAITDHDLVYPGLYAAEYAQEEGRIKIIPGIECEIIMKTVGGHQIFVHILGLGVKSQPDYVKMSPFAEVVDAIHTAGGIAVMAHPQAYPPYIFHDNKHLLDGVEVYNGIRAHIENRNLYPPNPDAGMFNPGDDFIGLRTYGSDKHYEHGYMREQEEAMSEHEEEVIEAIITGKFRSRRGK